MIFFVILLVLVILLYLAWGFYKVLVIDRKRYAEYWQARANELVEQNAVRLLALGDSTFQSIGATKPELGTVGRVAAYVEQETHRPVHVTNVSVWGAKAEDVVNDQLPRVDVDAADIIVVAVGANDAIQSTNLAEFRANVEKMVASLPQETVVMADVAGVKNREKYQDILDELRVERGLRRADLRWIFDQVKFSWQLSGRDFFHPSDYGYKFWLQAFQAGVDNVIEEHRLAK